MFKVSKAALDEATPSTPAGVVPEAKAETPTPEVVAPTEPPQDPKMSARFAALSRAERKQKEQEASLKTREDEVNRKLEEAKRFDDVRAKAKENGVAFIHEAGLTYQDLTQQVLQGKAPPAAKTPEQERDERIAKLEKVIADQDAAAKESKRQESEGRWTASLTEEVKKYELLYTLPDAVDTIKSIVIATYNESQRVMTNEEACKLAEDYLLGQVKTISASETARGKVASMFQPVAPPKKEQKSDPKKSNVTLTASSGTTTPESPKKFTSRSEEVRAAAHLLKFNK